MKPTLFTRKEAAARLNISVKTMTRMERRYKMRVTTYTGLEPVFTESEIKRAEFCRMKDKRATLAKLRAQKGGQ